MGIMATVAADMLTTTERTTRTTVHSTEHTMTTPLPTEGEEDRVETPQSTTMMSTDMQAEKGGAGTFLATTILRTLDTRLRKARRQVSPNNMDTEELNVEAMEDIKKEEKDFL